MNKFFTKKEMFQGEELESIYRVLAYSLIKSRILIFLQVKIQWMQWDKVSVLPSTNEHTLRVKA